MAKRERRPGFHHSTETTARISDSMMGHYVSERTKDRIPSAQMINYYPEFIHSGREDVL
jgi:hypothetical protein